MCFIWTCFVFYLAMLYLVFRTTMLTTLLPSHRTPANLPALPTSLSPVIRTLLLAADRTRNSSCQRACPPLKCRSSRCHNVDTSCILRQMPSVLCDDRVSLTPDHDLRIVAGASSQLVETCAMEDLRCRQNVALNLHSPSLACSDPQQQVASQPHSDIVDSASRPTHPSVGAVCASVQQQPSCLYLCSL